MSSGTTAGDCLVEETSIGVGAQNHVTGSINNAVQRVGSNIVEEEMDCLFCVGAGVARVADAIAINSDAGAIGIIFLRTNLTNHHGVAAFLLFV